MGFSLDGSKNGVGGRPGTVLTNQKLPDGGEAVEKSSAKVSILFAANYDMQPLPLLIIFPSKAKEPGYKMEMICALHQIKGKFGWPSERYFNNIIGKYPVLHTD